MYIDRGHIHNHIIIFNNVNMATGRCYQSNKKVTIKSDIKAINFAKSKAYLSFMDITKLTRKNTRPRGKIGLKMFKQIKGSRGKVSFNLI